ncbi:symmetrical bis(5'-nucleosyl)-tetraphosphatase [Alteromonas sp. 1_MG-2023]|uniref:symmetrical bis(5'-nucleosyl)-tetraphosphatase n=1 Tax=Alteromonas sp. 1_MG-2023 TaxID=3062669 RepID=UPI0026E36715|nr:symmetrical bis(5'-nucleosyl)-tetraphosphatase [Alteromonas sp. 1_MG-2023]MDO6565661.1 symmetrical bis(5'-nucleosyl)-tetraphosphatase [Alteromonas sp. 1_MG-2023]
MSYRNTYVVGDIQGCYGGLQQLLEKAKFDADKDKLYAVGDLVARGEDSLGTLRFLKSLGSSFETVLGNHDLHLLAVANKVRKPKKADNIQPLLDAPDLPELLDWLRQFPLAKKISAKHTIVHAGLYPHWSTDTLVSLSGEVSKQLQSKHYTDLLNNMYGNSPTTWSEKLKGVSRTRFIVNACTRMRFLHNDGSLEFDTKTHPSQAPKSVKPWFKVANPNLTEHEHVLFGHWAALNSETQDSRFVALDTGYVWGQELTMLDIDSNKLIKVHA